MPRTLFSLLFSFFLVAALGCETDETQCEIDADCGDDTMICQGSMCVPRCAGVDCDPGLECEPATGECVPIACVSDEDCEHEGFECRDGLCVSRCEGVDCAPPYECEPSTGECVGMACLADEECGDETYECRAGACTWKCEGVECPGEDVCHPESGECFMLGQCLENAHCPGNLRCIGGKCANNRCGPPDSEACQSPSDCDAGHDCVETPVGSYCLKTCSTYDDCPGTPCEYDYPEYLVGYCHPSRGQPAEYFGPCDAHGEGDGKCIGPSTSQQTGEEEGYCYVRGEVEHGGECVSDNWDMGNVAQPFDPSKACNGFCAEVEEQSLCISRCIFFGDDPCAETDELGPTTCYPAVWSALGYCREVTEETRLEGETCDPSYYDHLEAVRGYRPGEPWPEYPSTSNPCVADTLCGEEDGQYTCMRACHTFAEEGEAGACPDPDKTCVPMSWNPLLGICKCAEGMADCGDGCVALDTTSHCGACDVYCHAPPNAEALCDTAEGCTFECIDGYSNCDGDPETGCETEGEC